jgi:NAD(P)-dependent dehydrogenase (short-subunit alcohol dehydrogenase family)
MTDGRLHGLTALVTGAGTGIGEAAARGLAAEGAAVALCGRRAEVLERSRERLVRDAGRAIAVPMDARREEDVARAFDTAERGLGAVDVAVVSHGVNQLSRVEETPLETWRAVVDTNLTGVFLIVREAVRRMRPRARGRIVIVSSVSGRPGHRKFPGFAAYAASKYALTGLVEVLAGELDGSGIGVAMVCPAGVDTEMFRETFPGRTAALSAADVAVAIVDLADPAAPAPAGLILDLTGDEPRRV